MNASQNLAIAIHAASLHGRDNVKDSDLTRLLALWPDLQAVFEEVQALRDKVDDLQDEVDDLQDENAGLRSELRSESDER